MIKSFWRLSLLFLLFIWSCSKESVDNNSTAKSSIKIEFDNIVGDQQLQLNTGTYTNAAGEKFNVSTFNYYVSNFKFIKTDGTEYIVPKDECYFLIREEDKASQKITMSIPEGEYSQMSFIIGVDSLKNVSDISQRKGCLDIVDPNTMYWEWNSGYIFLKLEGSCNAIAGLSKIFMYHIGLFGGDKTPTLNNIRTIKINLKDGGMPKVSPSISVPNVHLLVDANKLFTGFKIVNYPSVMVENFSANIANNFSLLFTHDHTEQ